MFLKNLSIRIKLMVATGAIVLACIFGLAYIMNSLNYLADSAEKLSRPQVQTILTSAALAHSRWASEVQEHLLTQKTSKLTVTTDGRQCAFGKWFYSDAKKDVESEYPDLKPIFGELDELHIAVHESAIKIQERLDSQDLSGGIYIFTNTTYPLVLKVEELLFKARDIADLSSLDFLQSILTFIEERSSALIIMSILFFICFPLFSFLLISSISKPINTLMQGAKRIANGEFVPVELEQQDEMGQLAISFNHMVVDLKKNLGLAQALMKGITMPFIVCNTEGKVMFVNSMMLDCWGEKRSAEDCIGDTSGGVMYGVSNRTTRLDKIIKDGTTVRDSQVHVVLRDGSEKFFNVNASPLRDMDGEVIGVVALYSDLSQIYEQQMQIEKLNDSIYLSANEANRISNKQSAELEKLVLQLENTAQMAEKQAQASYSSTNSLQQITDGMRQMASEALATQEAASAVRSEADDGMEILTQTIDCIGQVSQHTSVVANDMKALDVSAENIGRILNLIKDIADQTNLLALNAAIEAARAGDAGRGFAVVADEVRKLAEKTMEATNEVASAVNSIQNSVHNSVASTNTSVELTQKSTELAKKSGESLERIRQVTQKSVESANSISEATNAQSKESEAALQMLVEINEQADQTQQNMSISTEYAATLRELSTDLRAIIDKMCDERRSCARYVFTEETSVRWDSEEFGNGMTAIVNISSDGMCLKPDTLPSNLPVGSTITLHSVGGPLATVFKALTAHTRWVTDKGVGIEFTQTQAIDTPALQEVLRRLPSPMRNFTKNNPK